MPEFISGGIKCSVAELSMKLSDFCNGYNEPRMLNARQRGVVDKPLPLFFLHVKLMKENLLPPTRVGVRGNPYLYHCSIAGRCRIINKAKCRKTLLTAFRD
jgi:hypothetical protein